MFKGSYVALVTPFKNGKVDEKKLRELIEWHIKQGTDGLVPCGCTGEAATLSHEEHKHIIKVTVEVVDKRIPVIVGTGSNCTEEALMLTKYAKKAGADGALMITPYYNKPTPEGQYRHYAKVANAVDIPIMLYNVPSRTGICMLPETIARLSKIENIVAVKEAAGSIDQVSQILSLCNITVLSGDDSLTLPMMAVGAKGVVSVVANIVPSKIHELTSSFLNGNLENAKKVHYEILKLCKVMFIETNPIPVKTAMGLMKKISGELRMPLCEISKDNEIKLKKVLEEYRLI